MLKLHQNFFKLFILFRCSQKIIIKKRRPKFCKRMVLETKKYKTFFFILCLSPLLIYLIFNEENFKAISTKVSFLNDADENDTFEYRLNPKWSICDKRPQTQVYLFIAFVIISPHQFEQRNHIRNTWANKQFNSDLKVIFTVALSKNQTVNKLLIDEFNFYGDILQIENLIDSYYNCSIKIMKTYKWISNYCSNTKYILKICDDVVVNTPELIRNYKNLIAYKPNHIYGYGIYGVGPIRNPSNKWYVSEKEFNGTNFPPYIQGNLGCSICINVNIYKTYVLNNLKAQHIF